MSLSLQALLPKPISRDEVVTLLGHLVHPAGRCDRQGFFVLAVALIVLQVLLGAVFVAAGLALNGIAFLALNLPLIWAGCMAGIKRLHDIGRPAWWIPVAFTGWFIGALLVNFILVMVAGPLAMQAAVEAKSGLYWVAFATTVIPAFGGLLWLHAAPGEPTANRFGDVPDSSGFSGRARASLAGATNEPLAA
jgi:uncharacterized membrane protein YhaH (DUF805 family)